MSATSPPTCSRIEPDRFALVVDKVREVLGEVDSHKARVFDADFWRWQYRETPAGKTRVYGILSAGRLLGYYHVPVYEGFVDGRPCDLAMVQEVAVSHELRGQGMFRRLAEFVTRDLVDSGICAAYTFPNRRSIHTFLKYNGYRKIGTLPAYILPVKTGAIVASKIRLAGIEKALGRVADGCFRAIGIPTPPEAFLAQHPVITPQMIDTFAAYQRQHRAALLRDAAYLRWRFEQRPGARHFYFTLQRGARARAAAIFKLDEMLGNPALLLMDFAFHPGEEAALLQLIQRVKENGAQSIGLPFNLIFACGSSGFLPRLKKIGFLPVPSRLNPRPLDLLARNLRGSSPTVLDPAAWHVTLADWDVM